MFPIMSDSTHCENWEHTASCSHDVVKEVFASNGPLSKVALSGLTFNRH